MLDDKQKLDDKKILKKIILILIEVKRERTMKLIVEDLHKPIMIFKN